MSLATLLWLQPVCWAGTAVWLNAPPDPTQTPGMTSIPAAAVIPSKAWSSADERAIAHLAEELAATRKLGDVFDGELQIMLRLHTALADVEVLRPEDRDLVWQALVFEGFAVQRYFQDELARDPAAASYRAVGANGAEVAAWLDAVALDPDRLPIPAELPGEAELNAYQELRARHLLSPVATIYVVDLPSTARLAVDGRPVATERARLPAGMHHATITVDDVVRERLSGRVGPGETMSLTMPASVADLTDLAAPLAAGPETLKLPTNVSIALSRLDPPVQLVVASGRNTQIYELRGDDAVLLSNPEPERDWLVLRAGVGGGWFNDGEFFLANLRDDPPYNKNTVNAVTPELTAGVELNPLSFLAIGAGVDLGLPVGQNHDLPVGDGAMRLRAYPHLALGHPYAQLTAGVLLPWHLGVGARAHIPMTDKIELTGAYVYGLGLTLERDDGGPDFTPVNVQTAWVAASFRLGL